MKYSFHSLLWRLGVSAVCLPVLEQGQFGALGLWKPFPLPERWWVALRYSPFEGHAEALMAEIAGFEVQVQCIQSKYSPGGAWGHWASWTPSGWSSQAENQPGKRWLVEWSWLDLFRLKKACFQPWANCPFLFALTSHLPTKGVMMMMIVVELAYIAKGF